MEQSVRTVYGAYLQTCHLLNKPVIIKEHSTLNEKFNIYANLSLTNQEVPRLKYIGIGNGGHKTAIGVGGIAKIEVIQHMPRNAALYNQLPFKLRLPEEDLTIDERANYRLRRLEVYNGVTYIAYYLKVLNLDNSIPQMDLKSVVDGVTYSNGFNPVIEDLNPTPPNLSNTGVNVTTGDYIACTAKVPFTMDRNDIDDFLNVADIIYGDRAYAMISELALCSGVDRSVDGTFNGVSSYYTEAIAVQVINFMSAIYPLNFTNNELSLLFNAGAAEPLLVNTTVNT